jgi:hypothetical protein
VNHNDVGAAATTAALSIDAPAVRARHHAPSTVLRLTTGNAARLRR